MERSAAMKKAPRFRKELFPGEGLGQSALGSQVQFIVLLRLLLLVRSRYRSGRIARELLQIVLQQADFHASAAHALGVSILIRASDRGIAHADKVDPVERNVM